MGLTFLDRRDAGRRQPPGDGAGLQASTAWVRSGSCCASTRNAMDGDAAFAEASLTGLVGRSASRPGALRRPRLQQLRPSGDPPSPDRRRSHGMSGRTRCCSSMGLNLPDGVAFSPSARWIAISNHNTGSVFMYRNNRSAGPVGPSPPVISAAPGIRTVSVSPPTVSSCLSPTRAVRVVHVYLAHRRRLARNPRPVTTLRVLSEKAYRRGRTQPGRRVARRALISTAACGCSRQPAGQQPLAFFDLRAMLKTIEHRSI